MNETVAKLLRRNVMVEGVSRALQLIAPRVDDVGGLIEPSDLRAATAKGLRTAELNQIAELDGLPIWNALEPDDALADPSTLAPVFQARTELYHWLVEQGRIHAHCPSCHAATELDLVFYSLALRLPAWRLTDAHGLLECPHLSVPEPRVREVSGSEVIEAEPRPIARRPADVPRAASMRIEFPSSRVGLAHEGDVRSAELGDVDAAEETAAWKNFVSSETGVPDELLWHGWRDVSYRAVLRASVALKDAQRGVERGVALTPDDVAAFFLADLHFIDIVYYATHDLPVADDARKARIRCGCGTEFLPVR